LNNRNPHATIPDFPSAQRLTQRLTQRLKRAIDRNATCGIAEQAPENSALDLAVIWRGFESRRKCRNINLRLYSLLKKSDFGWRSA
jgi:hypothetical protein